MKKSLLFVLILVALPIFSPCTSSAQTPIEEELKRMGIAHTSFTIAQFVQQAKPAAPMAKPAPPAFEVDISDTAISIVPGTETEISIGIYGHIKNLTNEPLTIGFVRKQIVPKFWTTAICFGLQCYSDWVSEQTAVWEPNETRTLVFYFRTPPGAQGQGDVDLLIYSPTSGDSSMLTYKATTEAIPVTQCRTVWFENPYGAEVNFRSVAVENPELFDIDTVLSDTTYPIPANGVYSVRFCHRQADGQLHSTKVIFTTDSGVFTQDLVLLSPSAGVSPSASQSSGIRIVGLSPNPASGSQHLEVRLESERGVDLTLSVIDLLGREISSSATSVALGVSSHRVSVQGLSAGSYIVLAKENSVIVDQASFNVTR